MGCGFEHWQHHNSINKEFHKRYVFKNNTREQLSEFLSFEISKIA